MLKILSEFFQIKFELVGLRLITKRVKKMKSGILQHLLLIILLILAIIYRKIFSHALERLEYILTNQSGNLFLVK